MLWTIVLILLILWALGGFLALGPLIHLLLVIALIVLLVQLISGRRVALYERASHARRSPTGSH